MLGKKFLEKIGFESNDIDFILNNNRKYSERLAPIVNDYIHTLKAEPFVVYDGDERNLSRQRANEFIERLHKTIPDENEYVLNLLAWLNCIPYLYDIYKKFSISEDIFYESTKDFLYKVKECKAIYGVCGLFTNWFFLIFELKNFGLGRLQYEVYPFGCDEYTYGDYTLKKGDRVYSCHIPASGKLTYDMCMDSFQRAYEFFKSDLSGDIIPIISSTWLLYEPYIDKVFPKESNIWRFAKLFDVIRNSSSGNTFSDSWRVFNKMYEGTTKELPNDNTLRRNFIEYINAGGDFGIGYGVILYDGKNKKIINIKK